MPTSPQPNTRDLLVRLDERVSLLMDMTTEIVRDNKVRNGRIEKLEAAHQINRELSQARHEALLRRIEGVEEHLTNSDERLSQSEIANLRAENRQDAADATNKRQLKIESPWVFLGTGAILAGPAITLALKFAG